jgi:hypothetical protein
LHYIRKPVASAGGSIAKLLAKHVESAALKPRDRDAIHASEWSVHRAFACLADKDATGLLSSRRVRNAVQQLGGVPFTVRLTHSTPGNFPGKETEVI